MHEKGETLLIPLHLYGVTSYFTSINPTMEDYYNCMHFSATAMEQEWDPYYPSFSAQEYALLTTDELLRERPEEFRGTFVTGMHTNPCKYFHECREGKLKNFLATHIIVSSVGGHCSTCMQPTDPTDLAAKWGIRLETARCTLE